MKKIINELKNFIKYHFCNLSIRLKTLFFSLTRLHTKQKKIFILGVAEHPNYGDFAISEAQHRFIADHFSEKIIEFNEEEMSNPLTFRLIESMLSPEDIIFCQGGGNHGNIYSFHEGYRRNIISCFKNNRIVLFPQTYYFTDDEDGKKEAEISKKIYNSHPDLVLAFRDKLSFNLAKDAYPNAKVVFCPDMVLYFLDKFERAECDNSVMMLLRSGVESKFPQDEKEQLIKVLSNKYTLKFNDHSAKDKINIKTRYTVMKNQIELYSKSSVVITEKLHGAIFTMLTGTPCIMVSTFNHKIKEVYKLFENCNGYYFANSLNEIPNMVADAINIKRVDNPNLSTTFEEFFKVITDKN